MNYFVVVYYLFHINSNIMLSNLQKNRDEVNSGVQVWRANYHFQTYNSHIKSVPTTY